MFNPLPFKFVTARRRAAKKNTDWQEICIQRLITQENHEVFRSNLFCDLELSEILSAVGGLQR